MTIRPRGRSYLVDVKVAGSLNPSGLDVRIRTSATDRDTAVKLDALIRAEVMRTGQWGGEGKASSSRSSRATGGTLKDALAIAWSHPYEGWCLGKSRSAMGQHRNAKEVIAILGEDTPCSSVTEQDYARIAETLAARHNGSDTVVRKVQALHRVLYFAELQGWIVKRPRWKRPTPGMAREYTFTATMDRQIEAYFRDLLLCPDMADLFVVGIETGARLGELLHLEARDVDLCGQWAKVRGAEGTTKTGGTRTVTLTGRALAVLKRRLEGLPSRGRVWQGWTDGRVSRRMRQAREAMGEEGNREFCFHACRHTAATRMAERSVPFTVMMQELGHKTPAITMRYVNMAPAARREAILKSVGESYGGN